MNLLIIQPSQFLSTSSLLGPNSLLSTLNLFSFIRVRDQVLYP